MGNSSSKSSRPAVDAYQVLSAHDVDLDFPNGLSFFDPYLRYFVKQTLEIGGEAYVSRTYEGVISGLFIYDENEKTGTIFTRSRQVFDHFIEAKPFDSLFSEVKTTRECEIYDIYTLDLEHLPIAHKFSNEISIAERGDVEEIERFMNSSHPGMNKRWTRVALEDGDKCFMVKFGNEIAGLGWLSLVIGVGRLHSLFVKAQFRRMGIGLDILQARLLWLKSKRALSAFSEISRSNSSSSRVAVKGGMTVSGQIFQYFKHAENRGPASQPI